jgi:hypothetical protein
MQRHLSHRHHGAARLLSSSLLPRMNSSSGPPAAQQQQQHLLMSSPLPPSPFHLHFHRRYSNGVIFSLRGLAVRSDIDTAVAVTNGEYCQCGSGRSNKLFEQLPTTKIRRQKRSSSSSKSTTGTGVGGNDRNIVASSGGSEPLSNYIAGRIIRKNNQQQQQSHSRINGTILRLDEQTNNDHSTQHRHHLNTSATIPPSQLRMHQRLPRHPNIPVHSLGKSTLSATDLHRWYLNQQREEKEKEREKYNQHQLQAAVDHQSIMKRGHNLGGGSIVALQSATVKYRQLRQRQQQRQHQISETKTTASFLQSTSVMERAAAATVIN